MRTYTQLTQDQRYQIYTLMEAEHNQTEIARLFNVHSFQIRAHWLNEPFLLSYGDIKQLFSTQAEWIRPLTLKDFFNLRRLVDGNIVISNVAKLAALLFATLPDSFWGSAFSPYVVVLIKKSTS